MNEQTTTNILQAHPFLCDYTTWTRRWDAEQTATFYIRNNVLCTSTRHHQNLCPPASMPGRKFPFLLSTTMLETFKIKIYSALDFKLIQRGFLSVDHLLYVFKKS